MSFQDCEVVFHFPQAVIYSGQEVTGAFHIKQPESKQIQGLSYKVTGKSKTRWTETHGSGKNRRTVTYYGLLGHMDTAPVSLLEGYPKKDGEVTIKPGLNTFNFSFTLPKGIPSSFEGLYGTTKYKLILTAERANKFDKTKKFPFNVICFTDLNINLTNSMPIKEVVSKHFSTFFIDQGSLEMTVVLPMAGYIPGQKLPIKCLVKNNSTIYISAVIFCLQRLVTFTCNQSFHAGIKTEKQKIIELTGQHVEKESESQLKLEMDIPNIPPTSTNNDLIALQYFIKVRAIVTGIHCNLDAKIPVRIGTIPVYTQNSAALPATTAFKRQQFDNPSIASYPSCPNLSQLPSTGAPAFLNPQFPASQNSQLPPYGNSQFPPSQNSQLPPYGNSQFPPSQNSQLPPYGNSQFPPSQNSQLPPYGNSQFPPLPNSQLSPFWNPQFPPLQNSQLPPFRSMHDLPTPSAPSLYSDAEQSRDSGLPTYKQAQKMLANMVKYDPDHRAE